MKRLILPDFTVKSILLVACTLCLAFLLASCAGGNPEPDNPQPSASTASTPQAGDSGSSKSPSFPPVELPENNEPSDSPLPSLPETSQETSTPPASPSASPSVPVETPPQSSPSPSAKQEPDALYVTVSADDPDGSLFLEQVDFFEGMTAYDALSAACLSTGVELKTKGSGSALYISSIGGFSEFDRGPLSGWVYKINGVLGSVGAGSAKLSAGDRVSFYYSLDLGADTKDKP